MFRRKSRAVASLKRLVRAREEPGIFRGPGSCAADHDRVAGSAGGETVDVVRMSLDIDRRREPNLVTA